MQPAASSARSRMNIGEVLDRLRTDFPGITIPKIRFLEDKGLIKPERTPAGYRKFTGEDVERLRYILRMQRDHYLPLKVIGEHLDAIDRGLEPPPIESVGPDRAPGGARRRRPAERGVVHPPGQRAPVAARAAQDRGGHRRSARPARAVRPDRAADRHRPLRHRRPGRSPRPPASWPTSASSPDTCARSRPPPTARSAWSSRSSRRTSAAATRLGQGARRGGGQRDRRAVGAAARHPGEVGPAFPLKQSSRPREYCEGVREVDVMGVRVEMPSNQPIVLLREVAGGPLPAHLDRGRGGHRDRVRPAGRRPAAAADPRPDEGRARRHRQRAGRGPDHRGQGRRLLRDPGLQPPAPRSAPARPTRSPSPCAPAPASSSPTRCSTRPASPYPPSRRTRSRSSASSSIRSPPKTSTRTENADPSGTSDGSPLTLR